MLSTIMLFSRFIRSTSKFCNNHSIVAQNKHIIFYIKSKLLYNSNLISFDNWPLSRLREKIKLFYFINHGLRAYI